MEQMLKPRKSLTIAIAIAALMVLTVSTLFFWQNISGRAKFFAQRALTEQIKSYVNGEVFIGNIDFTLPGQILLTDVHVKDEKDNLLAQSQIVKVYYNWFEFAGGNFDLANLARIERIFLQKCEIFVQEENSKLNWNPILQPQKGGQSAFNGKLQLGAAKITFRSPLALNVIDDINGEFDFKNTKKIAINLTGKVDKTPTAFKGTYLREEGELSLYADTPIDLAKLNFGRISPKLAGVSLKEGLLQKLVVSAKRDRENNWRLEAEGEFSGLGLLDPVDIRQGRGKFTGNTDKVNFSDLSFLVAGQHVLGEGSITWENKDKNKSAIDFSFSVPSFDPGAAGPTLASASAFSINIFLKGSLAEPKVAGDFSIAKLALANFPVSNITGKFYYTDNYRLVLKDINSLSLNGKITANGDLFFDNKTFELDIIGDKLDSSLLLGKDIQGSLDFSGHLSSRGKDTITKGNFVIRDGEAYGIPFQLFNGFFVKKGDKSDISDIAVRTAYGTLYSDEINRDALAKLVNSR